MKYLIIVCSIALSSLLSSCLPHSRVDVWKATSENDWGIERLMVSFEGWASFVSTKKNNALWRCLWRSRKDASDDMSLSLSCTAFTDVKKKQLFVLKVNEGVAELTHKRVRLAFFKLLDGKSFPSKKKIFFKY